MFKTSFELRKDLSSDLYRRLERGLHLAELPFCLLNDHSPYLILDTSNII